MPVASGAATSNESGVGWTRPRGALSSRAFQCRIGGAASHGPDATKARYPTVQAATLTARAAAAAMRCQSGEIVTAGAAAAESDIGGVLYSGGGCALRVPSQSRPSGVAGATVGSRFAP